MSLENSAKAGPGRADPPADERGAGAPADHAARGVGPSGGVPTTEPLARPTGGDPPPRLFFVSPDELSFPPPPFGLLEEDEIPHEANYFLSEGQDEITEEMARRFFVPMQEFIDFEGLEFHAGVPDRLVNACEMAFGFMIRRIREGREKEPRQCVSHVLSKGNWQPCKKPAFGDRDSTYGCVCHLHRHKGHIHFDTTFRDIHVVVQFAYGPTNGPKEGTNWGTAGTVEILESGLFEEHRAHWIPCLNLLSMVWSADAVKEFRARRAGERFMFHVQP